MRALTAIVLVMLPMLAQAHGDHVHRPHIHGEWMLLGASALIALVGGVFLLRRWLRQRR